MEKYYCKVCGYSHYSNLEFFKGLCSICSDKIRILSQVSKEIQQEAEHYGVHAR